MPVHLQVGQILQDLGGAPGIQQPRPHELAQRVRDLDVDEVRGMNGLAPLEPFGEPRSAGVRSNNSSAADASSTISATRGLPG